MGKKKSSDLSVPGAVRQRTLPLSRYETQHHPPLGHPGPSLLRARHLPACGEHEGQEVSSRRRGRVHHPGLVQLLQSFQGKTKGGYQVQRARWRWKQINNKKEGRTEGLDQFFINIQTFKT